MKKHLSDSQRRVELPTTAETREHVADFRTFQQEGTFPERKALIRNFVRASRSQETRSCSRTPSPMPPDGVTSEAASVLDFVQSGPPDLTKSRTFRLRFRREV